MGADRHAQMRAGPPLPAHQAPLPAAHHRRTASAPSNRPPVRAAPNIAAQQAFWVELRRAARVAKALPLHAVETAAEELHLALVSIPAPRRMLPLLDGAQSGGNLASILMVGSDGLLADAELATEALSVWLAIVGEGQVDPVAPAVVRGVALMGEMRNLLAAAPADTDWVALGVSLAMATADFAPLEVRHVLQHGLDMDGIWAGLAPAVGYAACDEDLTALHQVLLSFLGSKVVYAP